MPPEEEEGGSGSRRPRAAASRGREELQRRAADGGAGVGRRGGGGDATWGVQQRNRVQPRPRSARRIRRPPHKTTPRGPGCRPAGVRPGYRHRKQIPTPLVGRNPHNCCGRRRASGPIGSTLAIGPEQGRDAESLMLNTAHEKGAYSSLRDAFAGSESMRDFECFTVYPHTSLFGAISSYQRGLKSQYPEIGLAGPRMGLSGERSLVQIPKTFRTHQICCQRRPPSLVSLLFVGSTLSIWIMLPSQKPSCRNSLIYCSLLNFDGLSANRTQSGRNPIGQRHLSGQMDG